MSITRGDFLRSLGKSLPGLVASTGVATAAEALFRRVAQAAPAPATEPATAAPPTLPSVPFFEHGGPEGNQVALTFDDGPAPGVTERILDELKRRDLHATFFMIGRQVAAAPELAQRVLAEGHEIGNHTYTHRKLTELADEEIAGELDRTNRVFAEMLGYKAAWFRPPFGAFRRNQAALTALRHLGVALWSVDVQDWQQPPPVGMAETIVAKSQPGAIILCHELSSTADCIGEVLDRLLAAQFRLATLSSLSQTSFSSASA